MNNSILFNIVYTDITQVLYMFTINILYACHLLKNFNFYWFALLCNKYRAIRYANPITNAAGSSFTRNF